MARSRTSLHPGMLTSPGLNRTSITKGCAFTAVPEYQFGNLPKATSLRDPAPGSGNWDGTLLKTVSVKERVNFIFRAGAQNVFNHPWFAMPNTTLGCATFGQITSTYNNARSLQIGGRITF